jgi:hypothetical protein
MTRDYVEARKGYRDRLKEIRERERRHLSSVDYQLFSKRFDRLIAEVEAEIQKLEQQLASEDWPSALWVGLLFPGSNQSLNLFEVKGESAEPSLLPAGWLEMMFTPPEYGSANVVYYPAHFESVYESQPMNLSAATVLQQGPNAQIFFGGVAIQVDNHWVGHDYLMRVENRAGSKLGDLRRFAPEYSA